MAEIEKGPVEVVPEEDGGATIDFEPGAINIPGTENHFDNLADILPEENLEPIGSEMVQNYMDYKSSRKDWEQAYTTGLDLLGFKYENRTEPFQGASGATHPVLAEAVTQFQAQAYKELLPADGPVRTQQFAENFRDEKAGGGIAGLSGGDPEGAMTRSMNPDSQGLSYLFNRGKNT